MTAQAKKTATNIQKRKWQVKEMEEDYEHERSTGLTGNKNGTKQPWKKYNYAVQIDRIRVAAYCRVSTDGDEQLGSFESQKLYYEEKIGRIKNGRWQEYLQMKQLPEQR